MKESGVVPHVECMNGSGPLVMREAERFAEAFFRMDPSAVRQNCYDDRVLQTPPDRVVIEDIHAINATMAARSKPTWWAGVLSDGGDSPWLVRLHRDWTLFEVSDEDWRALVRPAMAHALSRVLGPYRGLSVATKVLHLKRPELIPVCDDLVRQVLGARLSAAPGTDAYRNESLTVIDHIRKQGQDNVQALEAIQQWLTRRGVRQRTLVRIFDALLWSSHADTWINPLWRVLER